MLFRFLVLLTFTCVTPTFAAKKNTTYGRPDYTPRSVDVESFHTYSRFSVAVDSTIAVEWKDIKGGFQVFLKNAMLTDLGAPMGKEKEWAAQFENTQDQHIQGLKIIEEKDGVRITGMWRFPEGDLAPAEPKMEHFEYRTDSPSRYVADFWPKPGPTVAEARKKHAEETEKKKILVKKEKQQKVIERRVASERRQEDAADVARFCKEPLSETNDVFLKFRPVHKRFDLSKYFSLTTPDSDYPYFEPKGEAKEVQYVRLALRLYRQSKLGLTVRTVDFFKDEFPRSRFLSELKFLQANAFLRLGHEDEAKKMMTELTFEAKGSPVALHSGMYLAGKLYANGEYLAALEHFLWLIKNYPEHRLAWVYHFGAAECLYDLKQTPRASREYEWVAEHAPERNVQAEAAYRIGDLYLERQQYEQAIAAYYKALKYFETESESYSAVYINRAEALYWVGQSERAEEEFKGFLEKYPGHTSGWRANFRLGEIFAKRDGDAARIEARKWYYNAVNNYPFTPGAVLARLRLMPCGDHGGFTPASAARFFENEAAKFDGGGEVLTSGYNDLFSITKARALMTMGQFNEAVKVMTALLNGKLSDHARELLADSQLKVFRKLVLELLHAGKKYEAVSFFTQYSGLLPNGPKWKDEYLYDYLMELARAASDLKLGSLAAKITEYYKKRTTSPGVTAERTVASLEMDQKLVASELKYTEAKALWTSSGMNAETDIRKNLAEVVEESPFSYQREVLLSVIEAKKNNTQKALHHALNAEMLQGKLGKREPSSVSHHELSYWIADLQAKAGRFGEAYQQYEKIGEPRKENSGSEEEGLGLPSVPAGNSFWMSKALLLEKQSRWGDAAQIYSSLMKSGNETNQVLYSYARAIGKAGKTNEAMNVYRKIASSKEEGFWKKLAQEALSEK